MPRSKTRKKTLKWQAIAIIIAFISIPFWYGPCYNYYAREKPRVILYGPNQMFPLEKDNKKLSRHESGLILNNQGRKETQNIELSIVSNSPIWAYQILSDQEVNILAAPRTIREDSSMWRPKLRQACVSPDSVMKFGIPRLAPHAEARIIISTQTGHLNEVKAIYSKGGIPIRRVEV